MNRQKGLLALVMVVLLMSCSEKQENTGADSATADHSASAPIATTTNVESANGADAQQDDKSGQEQVAQQEPATESSTVADNPSNNPAPPPASADHNRALDLARRSGCLACHAVDKKVVGPAWMLVSQRYKDNPQMRERLINKVKSGGRGSWTEVVGNAAMPPYSPRVTDENIAKLVDFILALAK